MEGQNKLFLILENLNINYISYEHPPLYRVEYSEKYCKEINGAHCKNLLLQDNKYNYYLVIILDTKKVELKKLTKYSNGKRLSFVAAEYLEKYLCIATGCVTPFALINDYRKEIKILFDEEIMTEETVNFHPLINTETINIKIADLFKFIDYCGQNYVFIKEFT